jgi:hypothetical protein
VKVEGKVSKSSLAVSGATPFSFMTRARMSLDERTKATDFCWPLYLRCRIHWSPSVAMPQLLEGMNRVSMMLIISARVPLGPIQLGVLY